MDLAGRVAIVTGGAAGLGVVIARRLAGEGCSVVVADLDSGSWAARGEDSGLAFVRCDVRVGADVERAVAFAVERFGGLDVLVNNAGGVSRGAQWPEASALEWRATLDLNLTAPMLATQLALEPMRARGAGAVVNIASSAGLGLMPYDSPEYGAAKAGLIRFTASVAGLRESVGVRVNCVAPHWIGLERACAATATWRADMARGRSSHDKTTSSPTSKRPSRKPSRSPTRRAKQASACRSGCGKPRPGGRHRRRSARA